MRYKLDIEGYVSSVAFGCYLDDCTEYTGVVPLGYNSLVEWSENACIQAYYIDSNGNLMFDVDRQRECKEKEIQEAIDNAPLVRKDLYESDAILDSQYIKATETGEVIVLEDIKTISPKVKITGIDPSKYTALKLYTQSRNMMPCTAKDETIASVTFTKNYSGAITIKGISTDDIEYSISNGSSFLLKANHDYYLNLGGFNCELRYFNGETSFQQYVGASGLLNLSESIKVTDVILKIPQGTEVNTTIFPQLEYGNAFTFYDPYKCKTASIDFSEYVPDSLYPSDDLFPGDTLYPDAPIYPSIEYILIQDGVVSISVDGVVRKMGCGVVGLYSNYNTIYASEDTTLEIEYSTKLYNVDSLEFLQGKATTSDYFKILNDGSIRAVNGYFAGKIEADSGYFKGEISGGTININNNFTVNRYGKVVAKDIEVVGGSIEIGSYFSVDSVGKMVANNAEITGKIIADSGTIGGFTIGSSSIYSDVNYLGASGVYIGKDGMSIGSYFKVGRQGDITLGLDTDIEIGGVLKFNNAAWNGIKYGSYEIFRINSASHAMEVKQDLVISSGNDLQLASGNIYMPGTGTYIQTGAAYYNIRFYTSKTEICSKYSVLGKSGEYVGFFGSEGALKKTVSKASTLSSVEASAVATVVNNLIDALKAYNLIG